MNQRKNFKIRYYRETIDDLRIADVVLPALAMRDVIHAVTLQLRSYRGDESKPKCAEILDEAGELLERIVMTPDGARLANLRKPSKS